MNINVTEKHGEGYYSRHRTWPTRFDLKPGSKVLDIGCGRGALGEYLKKTISATVCGLEITSENCNTAAKVLDRAVLGDIETMSLTDLGEGYDYIVFSDSLEHLLNPGPVLQKIGTLLNDDGSLLISMPNVRNFRVLVPLLFRDEWEYVEEGLLDKTHLRFFTFRSITRLLRDCGYEVEKYFYDLPLSSKVGKLNALTLGIFRKILTSHYFIKACKKRSI